MVFKGYCLKGMLELEFWKYIFIASSEAESFMASKYSQQKILTSYGLFG